MEPHKVVTVMGIKNKLQKKIRKTNFESFLVLCLMVYLLFWGVEWGSPVFLVGREIPSVVPRSGRIKHAN